MNFKRWFGTGGAIRDDALAFHDDGACAAVTTGVCAAGDEFAHRSWKRKMLGAGMKRSWRSKGFAAVR